MDIETVSYTKFRNNLASFINQVAKSHLPIFIERRNNEPAYLVSKEMYEYLVRQTPHKSKQANNIEGKPHTSPQAHVQVSKTNQQDLFT